MAILNPNHLFEQADRLISPASARPPRQVDLRRAISAAYYALFHLTVTALADEVVGVSQRRSSRYNLIHRGVDHRAIKDLCALISKVTPPSKYAPYLPVNGFGQDMLVYARAFIDLQEKRHRADYDVTTRYRTLDAKIAIATGRGGMARFSRSDLSERKMFFDSSPLPAPVSSRSWAKGDRNPEPRCPGTLASGRKAPP